MKLILGRAYCAVCRVVRTVVYAPGAEVRCPQGHLVRVDACGDERCPEADA